MGNPLPPFNPESSHATGFFVVEPPVNFKKLREPRRTPDFLLPNSQTIPNSLTVGTFERRIRYAMLLCGMARKLRSFQPRGSALRGAEKEGPEQESTTRRFRHATDVLVVRVQQQKEKKRKKKENARAL